MTRTPPAPDAPQPLPAAQSRPAAQPLRVAIIGAGPAGIYAGNILSKAVRDAGAEVGIDLFDSLPAPYGLIRYGVAPDHPRIKGIVNSLHEMLDTGNIRFIGNVAYGVDLGLDELRAHYHAVIFATGAIRDADLDIPGIGLPGSFGAADFVSWFDGHPDAPRVWPLDATDIAVIGNGNVALDVARMLAKHPDDLLPTDIPATVYDGLAGSPVTDVHVFGRRGPAQVKFTPIELRELGDVPGVDVIVYAEDFDDAELARQLLSANNQVKVMTRTLTGWLAKEPTGASRRLHLHFHHSPALVYGDGRVEGMRFERTEATGVAAGGGASGVRGTGEIRDYPLQAVYRAVGYRGSALPEVPFDEARGVIPNDGGRVLDAAGAPIRGLYATGWIKRGPVGLIGHTKGDALETITRLVDDAALLPDPSVADPDAVLALLAERGVRFTTWPGWLALDAHERGLGAADVSPVARERVKVVARGEQVDIARAGALVDS
ncbi:ferredoxin--NADP+ reductase [Cryobacterium psychrotolerans]|uniref:ferredoxin--NADP(+) reductase n=1 Tax=Cryobacterium psychrotolerans TaxID=386301 RepID=A0A1G9DTR2_9MICO|nr:FAD-dependent oxidoreductase [Cryobacterium psychrotolerans]TFD83406.1 pyridine nucleotide-disulfide oxidoreductase [Cryobacterium psychrotolerans]SDK67267.1 ferredoxin--NADP+ reductase [Cryobacterium psychrotolerans]